MGFFNFDFRKVAVLALLLAIPVLSINLQKDSPEGPWIFRPFRFAAGISQAMYSSFSFGVRGTTDLYLNLVNIKTDNRVLTEKLANVQAELGEMTELRLENERLNKLLDFKQKTKMDLMAAKIIGRDLFEDYESVMINRGSRHGVQKGMATITVNGVVGYVISTETLTSQILLLTDRYAVVDSIVQRSRARAILTGVSKDECTLKYMKRTDDVKVGDLVVTSGLDNVFPKGFPVGTVTEVSNDDYNFEQIVKVKPTITASMLEEVFVVLNAKQEDFETIAGASDAPPVEAAHPPAAATGVKPAEKPKTN